MNKKLIAVLIIFVCILILCVVKDFFNKEDEVRDNNFEDSRIIENSFDEETGLYYVKNKETGEILEASTNKEDLQFFLDNPDYNPDPLTQRSTSLQDFINYEESNELESLEQQ